jgi:hypothetical protein
MRGVSVLLSIGLQAAPLAAGAVPSSKLWMRVEAQGRSLQTTGSQKIVVTTDEVRVRFPNGQVERLPVTQQGAGAPELTATHHGLSFAVPLDRVHLAKTDVFPLSALLRRAAHHLYRNREIVEALRAGTLDEETAREAIARALPPTLSSATRRQLADRRLETVLRGVARRLGGYARSETAAEQGLKSHPRQRVIQLDRNPRLRKLVTVNVNRPHALHPEELRD